MSRGSVCIGEQKIIVGTSPFQTERLKLACDTALQSEGFYETVVQVRGFAL